MTYPRPKVKDAIDDHIQQIVENWCLVDLATQYPEKFSWPANHWITELVAQLTPGITKLRAVNYKQKAIDTLLYEIFYDDAHVENADIVHDMIQAKLEKEGATQQMIDEIVHRWLDEGLPEIMNVYRKQIPLSVYSETKRRLAAIYMEEHK